MTDSASQRNAPTLRKSCVTVQHTQRKLRHQVTIAKKVAGLRFERFRNLSRLQNLDRKQIRNL